MNSKNFTILAVVAAIAVVAAVIALRSDKTATGGRGDAGATSGKAGASPVLGDLASKVNDVAGITVKAAGAETHVELVDGQWRVKEKASYPADAGKVRQVLFELVSLRDWSERTSRPDLYKTLGVEDVGMKADEAAATPKPPEPPAAPDAEGSRSLLLTLTDKSGAVLASTIVGNTKWGQAGADGVYLRKPGNPVSYFASGKLDVPREPLTWVNNEFADIARDRVRSVTLTPHENAEADRIVVAKEKPGEGSFAVHNLPANKVLKEPGLPETLVAGLVKTAFEDISKIDAIDFSGTGVEGQRGKPGASVDVRTWDGLIAHVETTQQNDRRWWKLTASADPDPFREGEGDAAKPKRTPEEVKKEVDELNAKWAGWALSPFSYKSSAFAKKLSDELKEPEAKPVTPTAPSTGPGTATPLPLTPVPQPSPPAPQP